MNCKHVTVKGKNKTCGGYKWKYKLEEEVI